jgi:hypothetical protein
MLSTVSIASNASTWQGKVETIEVRSTSPVVLFRLSGELKDSPRCNETGMYAIDSTLPGGRIALDLLRSAYESKRNVMAQGLNACSVHFESEGVKTISFE